MRETVGIARLDLSPCLSPFFLQIRTLSRRTSKSFSHDGVLVLREQAGIAAPVGEYGVDRHHWFFYVAVEFENNWNIVMFGVPKMAEGPNLIPVRRCLQYLISVSFRHAKLPDSLEWVAHQFEHGLQKQ